MPLNHFDGPIPGSNFTSDPKNYPWRRPPEYTDLDKAIEYIGKRLTNESSSVGLLTMMQQGIPITGLAQLFLISGMGAGKWTLDFALMLAGPVAHIMVLMAKAYGIKYKLGLDDKLSDAPSAAFFNSVKKINEGKAAAAGRKAFENIDDIQDETSNVLDKGQLEAPAPVKFRGFISQSNPKEQEQMLGMEQPTEEGV